MCSVYMGIMPLWLRIGHTQTCQSCRVSLVAAARGCEKGKHLVIYLHLCLIEARYFVWYQSLPHYDYRYMNDRQLFKYMTIWRIFRNCFMIQLLQYYNAQWINILNSDKQSGSDGKKFACNMGDRGLSPSLRRSPGMATPTSILA